MSAKNVSAKSNLASVYAKFPISLSSSAVLILQLGLGKHLFLA